MIWSTDPFHAVHALLKEQRASPLPSALLQSITEDLQSLLITPAQNTSSREKLQSATITLTNQDQLKLNNDFILASTELSHQLNIDEVVAAEILFYANSAENGSTFIDNGLIAFYNRRMYILSIVSFLLNSPNTNDVSFLDKIYETVIKSFKLIHTELDHIKQQISKHKLLDQYSYSIQQTITYQRNQLFSEHEQLSQILYAIAPSLKIPQFLSLVTEIDSLDNNDLFMIHYLPGILRYLSQLHALPTADITSLFKQLTAGIVDEYTNLKENENFTNSPVKSCVVLIFCVFLLKSSKQLSNTVSFKDVVILINIVIENGSIEQILTFVSEIRVSNNSNNNNIENFKSLLQKNIPSLVAKQFLDIETPNNGSNTNNGTGSINGSLTIIGSNDKIDLAPTITESFKSLLAAQFHEFITCFITHGALILTRLRDTEEDYLLSNTDVELDDVCLHADLERFYLSIYFVYFERCELIASFWGGYVSSSNADQAQITKTENIENSELMGFLRWASKTHSPLLTSTYCIMVSGLCSGFGKEVYGFLNNSLSNYFPIANQANSTLGTANLTSGTGIESRLMKSSTGRGSNKAQKGIVSIDGMLNGLEYYVDVLSTSSIDSTSKYGYVDTERKQGDRFNSRGKEIEIWELGEDSIVLISSFLALISSISTNSPLKIKTQLFQKFKGVLTGFLNVSCGLDDVVINTLCSLCDGDKYEVWGIIDRWLFDKSVTREISQSSFSSAEYARPPSLGKLKIPESFKKIDNFSTVINFINLIKELSRTQQLKFFSGMTHPYPSNLGENYRKVGIWPYVEYLLMDVLKNSKSDKMNSEQRLDIQYPILEFIHGSLVSVDWKFIELAPTLCDLNLDEIFGGFDKFISLDCGIATLNFLYDSKVFNVLFQTVSVGFDILNESAPGSRLVRIVELGLDIINKVLEVENTYINKLLPHLKKGVNNEVYLPNSVGTHGLKTFYQAVLFNLPVVAHIALYIGGSHLTIAKSSLEILGKLSKSGDFSNGAGPLIKKDRLLTALETVDESIKIKFGFIRQLESEIVSSESLTNKVMLLEFLNDNLNSEPCISHFLLGFEIHGVNNLSLGTQDGNVGSPNSVLKSLIGVLDSCLGCLDGSQIDYAPARMSSLILEIIVKLCRENLTSNIVLEYLGDNTFHKLVKYQPKINSQTIWSTNPFNGDLSQENQFIELSGPGSLLSFMNHRSLVLQYLSLELHKASAMGSISKVEAYVNTLVSGKEFLNGSPKILSFLDILEFDFKGLEVSKIKELSESYDLNSITQNIKFKKSCSNDGILDLSILEKLYKLQCMKPTAPEIRKSFENKVILEGSILSDFLNNYLIATDFKKIQLSCLHSWVSMIQVIISDGVFKTGDRSSFILEVFQTILPKINDYLENDIQFAEELISLSVLLYDVYERDRSEISNTDSNLTKKIAMGAHRLYPLFQTCINGILCSQSTPDLRSDLYVLANKYLKQIFGNAEIVKELTIIIKSTDNKLIDCICNDSICAEGSPRITSILLLESLIQLSSLNKVNFVLNLLIKNNYLLLLVRSIKRTDEILYLCSAKYINSINRSQNDERLGITIDTLLYELTAFKSILYFLIRIAATRNGASQLIQCELFQLIKSSSFLLIDPDLGLDLTFDESQHSMINVNLSLDKPLSLKLNHSQINGISYFELLVPIFQLISAILLSMGSANLSIIDQARDCLNHFHKLVVGVIKRDALLEIKQLDGDSLYKEGEISYIGLKELVKLFVLLESLTRQSKS